MTTPSTTPTNGPVSVPFIDIIRFEPGFIDSLLPGVERLIRSGHFAGGPVVKECETALAQKAQAPFAVGCANGTDALQLALRAMDIKAGDRVLLPDMTFWATFESVVNVGASPITLDVDPETLHLAHATVLEAIERFKPRALILVHLYGWAAPDTALIRETCRKNDVRLLEDSAQAFGTLYKGQSLIGMADISTTSFYPAKVLGASGDAGAVFTKRQDWYDRLARLRNHGRSSHYEHDLVGWNSRLGPYEAHFLLHSLTYLDARLANRRRVCEAYRRELQGLPLRVLAPNSDVTENGYANVCTIEASERTALQRYLDTHKIGHQVIYPGAMSRQPGASAYLTDKIDHGFADQIAKTVINLPCFAGMTDSETDRVIQVVRDYFKR